MPYCVICIAAFCEPEAIICQPCGKKLLPSRQSGPGTSLFIYNEVLRKLILEAKINGNYRCQQFFLSQIRLHKRAQKELHTCQEIVPAPSSLYSRIKGRSDIAYFLASTLAQDFKRTFMLPPASLYWQFGKQSRKKNRKPLHLAQTQPEKIQTLIIDDVITSGYTFRKIATSLKDRSFRFLVVGDGRSVLKRINI